ncbi:MAG TPA: DUF308 domain-containing protein [Lacipirellulaceae bacterium]|jgi:uncharacterized membrane protein HdeD (DUF308 family)|nr:DUF308 domain-containing protein [Lacipirellulaceae bacterium]
MLTTVCKRWWVLMVRGIAAILFGICAIAWPGITLLYLVILFGIFSIVDGIAALILGFRGEADGTVWWTMVTLGVLAIAAGIAAFAWPGETLLILATIIAISAIVRGAFEIFAAITLRKELEDEWILGLSGAMSVIFGALIMFRPGAGLIALTLLIGAYMLALGVFAIALSLRLRMMHRKWAN